MTWHPAIAFIVLLSPVARPWKIEGNFWGMSSHSVASTRTTSFNLSIAGILSRLVVRPSMTNTECFIVECPRETRQTCRVRPAVFKRVRTAVTYLTSSPMQYRKVLTCFVAASRNWAKRRFHPDQSSGLRKLNGSGGCRRS